MGSSVAVRRKRELIQVNWQLCRSQVIEKYGAADHQQHHTTANLGALARDFSEHAAEHDAQGHHEEGGETDCRGDREDGNLEQPLYRFELCGQLIFAGRLSSGRNVHAEVHVLAINPFTTCEVLERTPELKQVDELKNFRALTQNGPHNQVSFRIAFAECIRWPRARCGLVIVDSEFNLTLFAEEQVWSRSVEKGSNVASLWTATACVSRVPGCVHQLPVDRCTEAQFIDEVKEQLLRCGALDALIREANDGRPLASFTIERIEVWHEWIFSPNGIRSPQPKWVNTTRTQPWLPAQRTPVRNLVLAGAHTRTDADVWSIEAAVESGRRAAQVVEPEVKVLPQYLPTWLRAIRALDDVLFAIGLPPALTVLLIGAGLIVAGVTAAGVIVAFL